jgi:hypothetical protein
MVSHLSSSLDSTALGTLGLSPDMLLGTGVVARVCRGGGTGGRFAAGGGGARVLVDMRYCSHATIPRTNSVVGTVVFPGGHRIKV